MAKKVTKREMYAQILSHTADPAEREFLEHEMELLDKKNASGAAKQTPQQKANEDTKSAILEYMADKGERMTVSMMLKEVEACEGMSNQKVSALVRQLKLDGLVEKVEEKGVSYFVLV